MSLYLLCQVDYPEIKVGELVRALLGQPVGHGPHDVAAGPQHAQQLVEGGRQDLVGGEPVRYQDHLVAVWKVGLFLT